MSNCVLPSYIVTDQKALTGGNGRREGDCVVVLAAIERVSSGVAFRERIHGFLSTVALLPASAPARMGLRESSGGSSVLIIGTSYNVAFASSLSGFRSSAGDAVESLVKIPGQGACRQAALDHSDIGVTVWPVNPTCSVVPDATLSAGARIPIRLLFCLAPPVVTATTVSLTQEQQFASLGDLKLQSGEMIRDCRIGYRTFGQLNADESNAVLFPTWFGGTTKDLVSSIGPGEIFDSSRYYIIAVDALSDGVSSSPSNSKLQPGMRFPRITIRDMVESQHELLTRVLHINHLKAVMGISMGGMQTFQWMVMYPDFMDKAVPIVGSPRLAAYDLLLWQSEIDSIKKNRAWKNGHYNQNLDLVGQAEFTALFLTTPDYYNQVTSREQVLNNCRRRSRHLPLMPTTKFATLKP